MLGLPFCLATQFVCVDRIEINHVFHPEGHKVGVYTLFWDWDGYDWVIRDWRDVKITGRWSRNNDQYYMIWREKRGLREELKLVRARSTIETWTLHDREVANREVLPVCQRRGI